MPRYVRVERAAQFVVHRERILQHPKELYRALLRVAAYYEGFQDEWHDISIGGLALEVAWPLLFDGTNDVCRKLDECTYEAELERGFDPTKTFTRISPSPTDGMESLRKVDSSRKALRSRKERERACGGGRGGGDRQGQRIHLPSPRPPPPLGPSRPRTRQLTARRDLAPANPPPVRTSRSPPPPARPDLASATPHARPNFARANLAVHSSCLPFPPVLGLSPP